MVKILSESDVERVLELEELLPIVADALVKQTAGEVERPNRPHYPVGKGLEGNEPLGTGLVMPAYIHGDSLYATKLVGIHEGNEQRGLPTIHAQLVLTNARTGVPEAIMAATTITKARTGCIGGLAVRELAPDAATVGVLGAGAQARWQTRAIDTVADLSDVRIHSPSDSRKTCATDLRDHDIPARDVGSAREAVEEADVVVTATTSETPVFPANALSDGTLVVGVGSFNSTMQEIEAEVLERAARVFADVPEEVAEIGDLLATDLSVSDLVPMGELLTEGYTRNSPDDVLVVESVGSAVLDAAVGGAIYERAGDAGTKTSFE